MRSELGKLLAVGRTAEVFDWDDTRIVKLLLPGLPTKWLEDEVAKTHAARAAGASAPKVCELVRVGNRTGVVFEKAGSVSFLDQIVRRRVRKGHQRPQWLGVMANRILCKGDT
jgi:hypothetical protein